MKQREPGACIRLGVIFIPICFRDCRTSTAHKIHDRKSRHGQHMLQLQHFKRHVVEVDEGSRGKMEAGRVARYFELHWCRERDDEFPSY